MYAYPGPRTRLLLLAGIVGAALLAPLVGGAFAASGASNPTMAPRQSAAAAPAWSTYLHDAARTGSASADSDSILQLSDSDLGPSTAGSLRMLWNYTTQGPIAAQPVVAGGTVYIGSYDGVFYALNEANGAKKWATSLGTVLQTNCSSFPRGITSTATVVGSVVYVGGGTPYWYALDAKNGKVLWKVFTGNSSSYYNWASPLIVGNFAYIGLASGCDKPLIPGQLWMLDLANHSVVHVFHVVQAPGTGGSIWTSPTYDAATHTVFVTTGNGQTATQRMVRAIIALNSSTLALKSFWQVPLSQVGADSDFGTTPTLLTTASHTLLVEAVNKNGVAYAWNRTNLTAGPLWEDHIAVGGDCPECGQGSVSSGAFDGTTLYAAGGRTTIGTTNYTGAVRAVVPSNGSYRWQFGAGGAVLPAVSYGAGLVVAGAGSQLDVLDAANGSLLFQLSTGHLIYGGASIVGNCIFASSTGGQVFALAPKGLSCSDVDSIGAAGVPPSGAPGPAAPAVLGVGQFAVPVAESRPFARSDPGSPKPGGSP